MLEEVAWNGGPDMRSFDDKVQDARLPERRGAGLVPKLQLKLCRQTGEQREMMHAGLVLLQLCFGARATPTPLASVPVRPGTPGSPQSVQAGVLRKE
ncbi:hypothetical protein GGTG_12038 [Gaeumannomyces tritici R3-111a-1]|uniref:Uncharacterized protein n=1 Tax=Gaeumannomyces tritici (strain R3-111a-1) TaxID=644352 RepID=J3PEV9_GAET3|nr:hypothetical protein GGTG_12038 [Gaeumannomyces tritici R3-111a-1]EJT71017.1 hypothetical protein GGTG_12038 [Gaeumannomyces tritici R3-111a-1]